MAMRIPVRSLDSFTPGELARATVDEGRARAVRDAVATIVGDVRARGDDAVLDCTRRFDHVDMTAGELQVTREEIDDAMARVDARVLEALELARDNIKAYHARQCPAEWDVETTPGVRAGMLVRPLASAGIYVPGGKAFYPSTVLMCAVPAAVAGVGRIVMATPPKKDKTIEPIVLASARVAGVTDIYKVGGAQAIAAMALGTATIPRVDIVVGPGNAYVSMAKQMLQGDVLIDSPAGPSEVLVVAGPAANPDLLALDLCAQAEHDEDAISILVVNREEQAAAVLASLEAQLPRLDRRAIIEASLGRNGLVIVLGMDARDPGYIDAVASVINAIAPEHLQLSLDAAIIDALLPLVRNAGAIFAGENAPVALGDYASGTNHVLPTNGMATRYSALNAMNFLKVVPVTRATPGGLRRIAPAVSTLATFEGLQAHARTVDDRVKLLKDAPREEP